jgi:hypothetical protein
LSKYFWLNQISIWLSIITQKAIRRGTFGSAKGLVLKIDQFVKHYNKKLNHSFGSQQSIRSWKKSNDFVSVFQRRDTNISSCNLAFYLSLHFGIGHTGLSPALTTESGNSAFTFKFWSCPPIHLNLTFEPFLSNFIPSTQ